MTTTVQNSTAALVPTFTLADRLRKARELTGLTIAEFSELVGISTTTVTNYEHGHRAPRRIYLEAWSRASGVDLKWLAEGKAEAPSDELSSDGADVRPEGFEPPTFCSGASTVEWVLAA